MVVRIGLWLTVVPPEVMTRRTPEGNGTGFGTEQGKSTGIVEGRVVWVEGLSGWVLEMHLN